MPTDVGDAREWKEVEEDEPHGSEGLFQVVFKVTGDGVVEVYSVGPHHVVLIAWIGEEVWVGVSIDAGTYKG